MSLAHSLAAADAIHFHINDQLKRTDNRATTDLEKAQSRHQKAKALKTLDSTLSLIKNAVQEAKKGCGDDYKSEKPVPKKPETNMVLQNGLGGAKALGGTSDSDVDTLIQTMSADKVSGLGSINPSLEEMANSCEPIMTNFDSVLSKPYLNGYSATINSVPVVGLRDQSIMYVQTQVDPNITGTTKDVWSLFSAVPAGVVVDESKKVHFFPYGGDFCFSFGKSVWKKEHRVINPIIPTESDPEIAQATDNWPKLYKDDWEKVGDSALSDDDLLDVIPFSILAADSTRIGFHLMTLKSDSSINILNGDTLTANNNWSVMQYVKVKSDPNSPQTAPKWTRMAYWNNTIVGLDDSSNTWDISPDFSSGTYTAVNKTAINPIIDMTASDVGAIGVQADGFMYKRVVVAPKDDKDQPTLNWTRWIKTDGVKDLGVASPGVILDLQLLTRTLKSRYIETQTALYPAINTINGFAVTHAAFLKQLQDAATDWANADGDAAKQDIALKNGKKFVTHASVWAGILDSSTRNVKTSVNIMAAQLIDVNRQLLIQLQLLKDKLERLKATLSTQEDALSKLQAAFWGMVAATLLSIVVTVIGVLTANPYVLALAGVLFVGGIVGMVALSTKMSDLAGKISDTSSQISTVTEAINELTAVTTNFGNLAEFYATLNMFWGRMVNNAGNLKQMDNATAIEIGYKTLEDTSSIDAALDVTNNMASACTTYLDVLNKQGITIPDDNTGDDGDNAELLATPKLTQLRSTKKHKSHNKRACSRLRSKATGNHKNFQQTILQARSDLEAGDHEAYALGMTKAFVLHQTAAVATSHSVTAGGLWFDTAALNASGALWYQSTPFGASTNSDALNSNMLNAANDASSNLVQAKESVTSLVNGVIGLADVMMTWEQEYPEVPEPSQKDEVLKLQDQSFKMCNEAIKDAAMANNSFVSFNHKATDYTLSLNSQIGQKNSDQAAASSSAESQKNNIDIPWYLYVAGAAAVLVYRKVKEDEIDAGLRDQLNSLSEDIRRLKEMQDSGVTIDGQAATWMGMAQSVSEHLGSIYNILSGALKGQLLEDPTMYADLIRMEWQVLRKNAQDVLAILQAQSKPTVFTATVAKTASNGHALKSKKALRASSTGNKDLLNAFLPSAKFGSNIDNQANSALNAFSDLDALLRMPYGGDIIVKWEENASKRVTLLEVSANLRREYVSLVAGQYDTMTQLQLLSLVQKARADNAASGKLTLATFASTTLATLRAAQKAAKNSANKFENTADKFEVLMKQIDDNIDALQSKIQGLDDNIASLDKQARDKIIWVIADCIALAFSIGAMLVAFGVVGPVAAAITLAAKIGATAALAASSIKLVLDSIDLADLVNTVSALKQTRRDILASVGQLKAVEPLFRNVVEGVAFMSGSLDDMVDELEKAQSNVELMVEGSLSEQDAEEIGKAWEAVGIDCTSWLDVVNAQGINPSF